MSDIPDNSVNNLQLLSIPQLMGKHFFIPDYQRGYRWEKDQIYQLLRDLWVYFEKGYSSADPIGFYCLQPIFVKACSEETISKNRLDPLEELSPYDNPDVSHGPRNDVWYEVIDGQQRLTTIRILIAFHEEWNADECNPFTLRYATRPELKDIFDNIIITRKPKSARIDEGFKFNNIDVEYIKDCAEDILRWFADDTEICAGKGSEMTTFLSRFYSLATNKVSVQVIWYETKESTDARDIFERLNNLKVPLSSSELIRALFLSDSAIYQCPLTDKQRNELGEREIDRIKTEDKQKKQLSINAKWDEIEHFFHNDAFWGFITNRDTADYRNRIELLFDFMSAKYIQDNATRKAREQRLYTFSWFSSQKKDLWELWKDVLHYYDTIRSWFEDRDLYHKIGYIIHEEGDGIIVSLLKKANDRNVTHSAFRTSLDAMIRGTIRTRKPFSALSYEDKNDYEALKSLLFLYNVEYTRVTANEPWFPFASYKANSWTLEHIHAQNAECLDASKRSEWLDWITFTISARSSVISKTKAEQSLINDLKACREMLLEDIKSNTRRVRYEHVVELFQRDLDLWSGGRPITIMHLMSNLALLSGDVNSGIGKGSFSVKQQYINRCIADGDKYIPVCTKRVFLKHYYRKDDADNGLLARQMLMWDDDDRSCYQASIQSILSTYFPADKF